MGELVTAEGRTALASAQLSPAGRQAVDTALAPVNSLTQQIVPLRAQLERIGPLGGVIIRAELGDCRRLRNSEQLVRFTGLDVMVNSSDGKRSPGRLARQGPPEMRWALFEVGNSIARQNAPDHYY